MLKKILLFIISMVMALATVNAGTWKIHSYYLPSGIQDICDTDDKVFYLNSGHLFQFDKSTHQTVELSRQNKLSDSQISGIYYDWSQKLLFIAYVNANIDIMDANGKVYNVSSLKDVVRNVRNYTLESGVLTDYKGRNINDINFAGGIAYVALDYGYVTIDESAKRFTSENQLGVTGSINSVAVTGSSMLFLTSNYCYFGPLGVSDPMSSYSRKSGSFSGARMYPINETSVFLLTSTSLYNFDFSSGSGVMTKLVDKSPSSVQKTPTGFIANFAGQNCYYTIDVTGKTATKVSSVAEIASSCPSGDGTIWVNDANGLHKRGSSTNYAVNAITTDEPFWLKYNATLDKLYVGTTALNGVTRTEHDNMAPFVVNTYDGSTWRKLTPYTADGSSYEFVIDPMDGTTYVRASWKSGIHKVTNDELKLNYKKSNSLVGTYKAHPAFDNYGNMWVVSSYIPKSDSVTPPAAVLKRSKYEKSSVAKTDWFQPSGLKALSTDVMQRSRFVISKKNNVKIYCDGDYPSNANKGHIICWDNGKADPTIDNYKIVAIANFIDQNSRQIDWTYLRHIEEDNDGLIWVGFSSGLFVFDPQGVFDDYPRAVRPFVSKSSEGTGYLCEGTEVFDIGVTQNNEKWIATNNGVYHVSPDGTELYDHFTVNNSDLPSNLIHSIECDTVHGRVYAFTSKGFVEYVPDAETAAVDFADAYAYPNPVEPDFTGMVKIAGLMENTYVTITDSDGAVIARMGPADGSVLWDVCGSDGDRVPTGRYKVFAAQGSQPAVTGKPVTSVLVIK